MSMGVKLAVIVVIWSLVRSWAGESGPGAGSTASGTNAPENPDTLLLENGETLRGTLLNDRIKFTTAYALIDLDPAWVTSIDVMNDSRKLSVITTVNSNRFTGVLDPAPLVLQNGTGDQRQLRREAITRIMLAPRNQAQIPAKSKWVGLRNGDLLSGLVMPNPLPVVITNAQASLNLDEIPRLTIRQKGTSTSENDERRDGDLSGRLATEYIVIELDCGPKVEIFRNAVAWIGHSVAPSTTVDEPDTDSPAAPLTTTPPPESVSSNLVEFVWIGPGEFKMGSPSNEPGRELDEGPQAKVQFETGFWMAKYEVTQGEFERMMGRNPSPWTEDPNVPVVKVNWFEAVDYCTKLTKLWVTESRLPRGYAFRLPTEAEWEYACRAGTATRFSFGEDKTESELEGYAWFARNSDFMAHPVGKKKPNPWGLYDMHGNVLEWCLDHFERPGESSGRGIPAEAASGGLRVARGGSWLYEAKACRSANRDDYNPSNRCSDIGFRVVLAPLTH